MLKDFLWNHFERTGDISAYLGFKEFHKAGQAKDKEEEFPEE